MKKNKPMLEVSKGYEEFIKGKQLNNNNGQLFEMVIKKASRPKPKPRGSK
jgi:hypothetical protein